MRLDPRDPGRIYAVLDGRAFVTTNGGTSWASFGSNTPPLLSAVATDLVIDPAHPDLFYLATDQGVFRSDDGGASWADAGLFRFLALSGRRSLLGAGCGFRTAPTAAAPGRPPSPASWARGAAAGSTAWPSDPRNPDVVYAAGFASVGNTSVARIWKSVDGGATWQLLGPEARFPIFDPIRSGRLYEVRPTGLARSDDGGRTFRKISDFPLAGLARLGDLHVHGLFVHPTVPHLVYADVFTGIFQNQFTEP
jgi:hypothetical protein